MKRQFPINFYVDFSIHSQKSEKFPTQPRKISDQGGGGFRIKFGKTFYREILMQKTRFLKLRPCIKKIKLTTKLGYHHSWSLKMWYNENINSKQDFQ